MDKIAIIIVHYNTNEDTKETLESLAKIDTSGLLVRTFVVDNASKQPLVLSKQLKNVQLIRSDTNLGFTGGNNLGLAVASKSFNPEFFLLLNSDTLVKADFLQLLYRELKRHPQMGMVAPKIYFAPGCEFHRSSYQEKHRGQVIWFMGGIIDEANLSCFHLGVDEVDRGQFTKSPDSHFLSGCCVLVRREALAVSGTFDDRYFLYFEDADLSRRMRACGFTFAVCPQAVIWHKNGGSTLGSGSDLQTFYLTRNRLLFFFLHGNWWLKLRVLKLAYRLYRYGSRVEKKAAINFFLCRFGKQLIV